MSKAPTLAMVTAIEKVPVSLTVGAPNVTSVDELVAYKNKRAVISFEERIEIVRSIKYVDAAVPQDSMDKMEAWQRYHFDLMFVGDDWFKTPKWQDFEAQFKAVGVRIVYFPYTRGTSSTMINQVLLELRNAPPKT